MLNQASELVFVGDAGNTEASRPSKAASASRSRPNYRVNPWLAFDAEFAATHARFVGFDQDQLEAYNALAGFPQAQIGQCAQAISFPARPI